MGEFGPQCSNIPKIPTHKYITNNDRLLRTNNPKCVYKYRACLLKHEIKHEVFKKVNAIQVKINNKTISQSDIFFLNDIDESITTGAIKAEQALKSI